EDGAKDSKELTMERFIEMTDDGWYSGDLFLQRPPSELELLMKAEDLHVVPLVAWSGKLDAKSSEATPIKFDKNRFYQQLGGRAERDPWGLLFFNLEDPLDLSKAAKEFPSSIGLLKQAKESLGFVVADRSTSWDLPALVATGQLDAVVIAGHDVQRDGA